MQKKIYTKAYVSYYIDLQVATSHTGTPLLRYKRINNIINTGIHLGILLI